MIEAIIIGIILVLLIIIVAALLNVFLAYLALREEFKEEDWMDNSEFDYGHDVQQDYKDFNY